MTLLPRRLLTHFDCVETGVGYTRLHRFGATTGRLLCDFSLAFCAILSTVTGSKRILALGVDVVLDVVRMAVNEQFPKLIPILYPGSMAKDPKLYASLDRMWKAFSYLTYNMAAAVNGEDRFCQPVSSSGARSSAPFGPRPAGHGVYQGRVPPQTRSRQTRSSHSPSVTPINDPTDAWLDQTSNL